MSGVFISYRREDSQAIAGRLFDRLARRFGKDFVFRDIDAIDPGAKFADVIQQRVAACDVLVALIGSGWLEAKDEKGQRRLDLTDDFVRIEIAEALAQGKVVIPVLIEETPMPASEALPRGIAQLAERAALKLSDSRFDHDFDRLLKIITKSGAQTAKAKPKPEKRRPTAAMRGRIEVGGNLVATAEAGGIAVVAAGPVTIGITLAQYEEQIGKRERELRDEFAGTSRTDKDRIEVLEKQLAAAQALARSPEQALENYKVILTEASFSLRQLTPKVSAKELEGAQQGLARGNTSKAELLYQGLLGQDKLRAGEAAYQLGELTRARIDYMTAATYFATAATLQPDNPRYLNAAGFMAHTLGRYAVAEGFFKRALEIRKKAHGPEHVDVAASLNNLGALYQSQGRYAEAEPLLQQSIAIRKAFPAHPDLADSLNNLGMLYYAQRLYAKAQPPLMLALAIRTMALGPEHSDVATSLNNLALIYCAKGVSVKAETLLQKALAIRKKLLGPEHPDVATSLNNLAGLYQTDGFPARAEPLHEQALAIRKKTLGLEHPDVATSLNNLGVVYYAQGLYAKAEQHWRQALAIMQKTLGSEHPNVATSLESLATLLAELKRDDEAALLRAQAKAIREGPQPIVEVSSKL